MKKKFYDEFPLVYSCSGCSNTAQLANSISVELDREQFAEMSCIAGVGGGVPSLVNKATSGWRILAIDGCPLHCVKHCLEQVGAEPTRHYTLTEHGLLKVQHGDCSPADTIRIKARIIQDISTFSGASDI
ncbi:putative zinc-binding protein [Bythopirellula polymerisocia]|uniref:DGC domain protein n=1 Tax=Bythopirellula polymerisocia TaxID=2528003 RepID=A0A5C6CEB4_9BACT|nr:putative zinc-binding protein [Bythopirellula polymerisocia]TWU21771.1 DGC domain protein [Bythopirellula polymerisocia]